MERLYENWERVENKIINLVHYWKMFNLSIGGRIMVAKTYLFRRLLTLWEGPSRLIAQDRWYLEAKYGGYGIMDLVKMNVYMKASWIPKWVRAERDKDYVKERVMSRNYNNFSRIELHQRGERNGLISGEIIGKWL
jgi:hypothetical protein